MSVNKVLLLGRLGKDPEVKHLNNSAVCNLSVATSESWTDKQGQKQEKTEWHRVQVWGKLAELCGQYLAKGRQVYVEGRLQTRSWDKDGQKQYVTEVVATTIQFLGGKPEQGQAQSGWSDDQVQGGASDAAFAADDIPF